jgi:hypothetical protein
MFSRGTSSSDNVKRWFGDSKVVDAEGKPLVVYHGTVRGDVGFQQRERGTYFTSSPDVANGYTSGTFLRGGREGAVYPAYLSMQDPLVIDAMGKRNDNIPFPGQEWRPKVFGNLPPNAVSVEEAFRRAIEAGHDGLIVRNVVDTNDTLARGKSDVFAVKSPTQIAKLGPAFDKDGKIKPQKEGTPPPVIGPRQWPKVAALITRAAAKKHVAPLSDSRPALVVTPVVDDFTEVTPVDVLA